MTQISPSAQDELADSLARRLTSLVGGLAGRIRGELLIAIAHRVVVLTDSQTDSDASIVMALLRVASENISQIEHVSQRRAALQRSVRGAEGPAETRAQLRVQIEALESDGVELARDLTAVNRWLDLEALDDRLSVIASEAVDHVEMAYLAATKLIEARSEPVVGLAQSAALDTALEHAKSTSFEVIAVGALDLIRALLELAPVHERLPLLGATHLRALNALVADAGRPIWINVAALRLLCRAASTSVVAPIIEEQLLGRERKDGMFLRHAALQHAAESGLGIRERLRLMRLAMDDPSEHVRQGLALALAKTRHRSSASLLGMLVLQDPSARVRAYALLRFFELVHLEPSCAEPLHTTAVEVLQAQFDQGGSDLVVRTLCRELRRLCQAAPAWFDPEHFVVALDRLLRKPDLPLELAAEIAGVLLTLEVYTDPVLNEVRRRLREVLAELLLGDSAEVEFPPETRREHIEKALGVVTHGDHAVSLKRCAPGRYRVTRGERRAFRFWRFWFELMTPGPDKRQAHHHSAARAPDGETVAAPRGMAEVTKTRVPGERRVHAQINGWGEFLPLVDDFIFACGLSRRERHVVCSFGTITIVAPDGFWPRLWTRIRLNLRFTRAAALRERSLEAEDADTRRRFVDAMQKLGFALRFEHQGGRVSRALYSRDSPSVKAYYSASVGLLMPVWMDRIFHESALATNNSVWHLAVTLWLVLSAMVIRAAWIRRRIDQHRRRFRLCIGGWGSRGKSGTERLKAALFHALRFDVVVKTTGCEAMFIHARRDMPARELFVYRAYDRATIWEQEKILDFAHRLNAEVFLWECMALRPEFVRVLQEEWMRDDITTLTNAYPDHEDIMGPSGEEVAQVIASFSGAGGVVFTSETQMLPVLKNAAEAKGSRVVAVSDLDAELLPRDLLARFPYAEHPNNIALVLAVAEHLGISRDWALAKIADHVVPDLGVLKTYPTADYRTRKLTFSNGMSANERAGFMSNWIRLGLNELAPERHPETMVVAVVNNRADRVPRSRVFAELLTWDAVPERLVLIGTNLITLERLLKEGAERYIGDQSLAGAGGHAARVDAVFRHFKLASGWPIVRARLRLALRSAGYSDEDSRSMLPDADSPPEGLKDQIRQLLAGSRPASGGSAQHAEGQSVQRHRDLEGHCEFLIAEYERAARLRASLMKLLDAGKVSEAEQELKVELTALFMRRVTVVHDSHAKGDQVIHQVAMVVPPGHHAQILGCQNIKGTGLDFAYRWVSLGQVAQLVDRLESERGGRSENLAALTTYSDYGLIESGYALQRVEPLMDDADWVQEREAVSILLGTLRQTLAAKQGGLLGGSKQSPLSKVLGLVEPWVDHLDSIRRARRARAIMNDLFTRRVGQAYAARLLREVVARGKGGWLYEDFKRRLS